MDKLVEKIIKIQLDIKLGRFMEEKLDAELKKLDTEKPQALTIYLLKYGRPENLTMYLFDYASLCKKKTQLRKAASSPSSKKMASESLETTGA